MQERKEVWEAREVVKLFTPRTDDGTRLRMQISDEDAARIFGKRFIGYKGIVTDEITKEHWEVYGAACSLPTCYCDAIVFPVKIDAHINRKE